MYQFHVSRFTFHDLFHVGGAWETPCVGVYHLSVGEAVLADRDSWSCWVFGLVVSRRVLDPDHVLLSLYKMIH